MRRAFWVGFVLAILAAGCAEPPPPEPDPEKPPEPNADQIYGTLKGSISALWGPDISIADANTIPNTFSGVLAGQRAYLEFPEALKRIRRDVEDRVRSAREAKLARVVKGSVGVYEVIEPGSNQFTSQKTWAELMIARPEVAVRGFMSEGGQPTAFLVVTDPATLAQQSVKVREGEEFYTGANANPLGQPVLRFVEIIGDNQGVRLEYLPVAGETWDVYRSSQI